MGMHYLNPRRAGVPGAEPDVEVYKERWRLGPEWVARCYVDRALLGESDTATAALAAARDAAGFGHVAEQPCKAFTCPNIAHAMQLRRCRDDEECMDCAWPLSAHPTKEPHP